MEKSKKMQSFEKIQTFSELKQHLKDRATFLHEKDCYLCHYTSANAANSIIKSGKWYIGSPQKMNDGLELSHADTSVWNKIFFASFMNETQESIAMWSMYAQPWSDGVMIRIPVRSFKEWVNSSPSISSANATTKKANQDDITVHTKLSFHAVSYTNAESKEKNDTETLRCGERENSILQNVLNSSELIGYVKDVAWSYEKEYRLRVDVQSEALYDAVSVTIPDDIINRMEIVTGPRFSGKLRLNTNGFPPRCVNPNRVRSSLFDGKLKWIYCDSCEMNN